MVLLEHPEEKKDKLVRRVSPDKKDRRTMRRKLFFTREEIFPLSLVSSFKREKGLFLILLTRWPRA